MTKVSSLPKTDSVAETDNVVISTGGGQTKLASASTLAGSSVFTSGGSGFVLPKAARPNGISKVIYYDPSSSIITYMSSNSKGSIPAGSVILATYDDADRPPAFIAPGLTVSTETTINSILGVTYYSPNDSQILSRPSGYTISAGSIILGAW